MMQDDNKAMNEPMHVSSIRSSLDSLEFGISRLSDAVTALQDRLAPVTFNCPTDPSMKKDSRGAASDLGQWIAKIADSLDDQLDRLNYTINSLDL